jgi:itaconate CoA-transferase
MAHEIAFGQVNDMAALGGHPHINRIEINTPNGPVSMPAPPQRWVGTTRHYGPVPACGEHDRAIRHEFSDKSKAQNKI